MGSLSLLVLVLLAGNAKDILVLMGQVIHIKMAALTTTISFKICKVSYQLLLNRLYFITLYNVQTDRIGSPLLFVVSQASDDEVAR